MKRNLPILLVIAALLVMPVAPLRADLAPGLSQIKTQLEAELTQVNAQISQYDAQLKDVSSKRKTLENEVFILNTKIKKKQLEIKQTQLELLKLRDQISLTQTTIDKTKGSIDFNGMVMGETMRTLYQFQRKSTVELLLANASVSNFISQSMYMNKLQESMLSKITGLKELKTQLETQEADLQDQQSETNALLTKQNLQRADLVSLQQEKNNLLAVTKGKESEYQKLLVASQRRAAEIKAQIYQLAGGTGDITFGQALQYANFAAASANVRPSFLLAILDYESKIGKNVGQCNYLTAMKPSERPLFEQITGDLGLDPNATKISCKPWYGWGGAMGPAQFLPSTWLQYKDRIAQATGHATPNPWNIVDAFTAAALKLADGGAGAQTYSAEWKAAMIYFAGGNWSSSRLRFYGDNVMALANKYDADIKSLAVG